MTKELYPLPAIIRPAQEDLAELAAQINAEHEAGEGATRKGLEHFRAAGERLIRAKQTCGHGKWLAWLKANVRCSERRAQRYIRLAKSDVTSDLEEQWRIINGNSGDEQTEESLPPRKYITLEEWGGMSVDDRRAAWAECRANDGDNRFNPQGNNESIEWALWSWNPVTGCEHNCPYCYARDIATTGPTAHAFPTGFAPTVRPGRLDAPKNTPFPQEKIADALSDESFAGRVQAQGLKTVFTCSMADLFGRWVPKEWIDAVLKVVAESPQWDFLFLTKFPQRMAEFAFPANTWVGTTVDCQARVKNAEKAFRRITAGVKWLSCEPLIEPLKFEDIGAFDWVVLGGASPSSQTPKWHPPRSWVEAIEATARAAGVPFYEKANLLQRIREYPGVETPEPTQAPEELRYLPEVKS